MPGPIDEGTQTVRGFKAAAVDSGLKKGHGTDMTLIVSEAAASAAGVFTANKVKAAPVLLTRKHIAGGTARAIIANAGNANACTGNAGLSDAARTADLVGKTLGISPESVLVASTGVIGQRLDMDRVSKAIPELKATLTPEGIPMAAQAIMTTDSFPKTSSFDGMIDNRPYRILGLAKGAGMIMPNMATMLCFILTDIQMTSEPMQKILRVATENTFNRITVDGDTSTNDMVMVMANGLSGAVIRSVAHKNVFQKVLDEIFLDLAKQLVRDGEGVTKLVEIMVRGAVSNSDARNVADTVAHSPLVKTSFFGEDANWGRIVGAVGRAVAEVDPDNIDVYFDDVQMVKGGMGCGKAAEAEATKVLCKPEFVVTIDLNMGRGSDLIYTCDFSVDYVRINADYRS